MRIRDWSSDVCSSDLLATVSSQGPARAPRRDPTSPSRPDTTRGDHGDPEAAGESSLEGVHDNTSPYSCHRRDSRAPAVGDRPCRGQGQIGRADDGNPVTNTTPRRCPLIDKKKTI